ncbi:UNVERIFIED_CONTAM: hypothetical protein HDU68_006086, partial [Siphonaria sp. JEL0065]
MPVKSQESNGAGKNEMPPLIDYESEGEVDTRSLRPRVCHVAYGMTQSPLEFIGVYLDDPLGENGSTLKIDPSPHQLETLIEDTNQSPEKNSHVADSGNRAFWLSQLHAELIALRVLD